MPVFSNDIVLQEDAAQQQLPHYTTIIYSVTLETDIVRYLFLNKVFHDWQFSILLTISDKFQKSFINKFKTSISDKFIQIFHHYLYIIETYLEWII